MIKKASIYAITFIMILCLCACSAKTVENVQTVKNDAGSVNGEIITSDELNYYIMQLRTSVINKYVNDYGITYSDNFWNEEVSGVSAQEYLKNLAFDECVKSKIQLTKCKEYDIFDDISFSALKAKAEKINADNAGKKTVGISSIDMNVFYTYYVETGALKLKNVLVENGTIEKESDYDDYIASLIKSADIKRS